MTTLLKLASGVVLLKDLFYPDEVPKMVAMVEAASLLPGKMFTDDNKQQVVDTTRRVVEQATLDPDNPATRWVYERMDEGFAMAAEFLGVKEPLRVAEPVKLLRYKPGSFIAYHNDRGVLGTGYAYYRRLSMSVNLSKLKSYTGGQLNVRDKDRVPIEACGNAGDAVVFHSEQMHRILHVESGVRHAIVNWTSALFEPASQAELVRQQLQEQRE